MDILAHGLWTQLVFADSPTKTRWLAVALSVAPDALAFIPNIIHSILARKLKLWIRINTQTLGEVARVVPPWVYRIYDVTHSIPIWALGFGVTWLIMGSVPWVGFAWLLHILVDIPTHTKRFFPTPFLWPLSRFTVDGFPWESRWYLLGNYGSLVLMYLYIYVFR